MIRGPGISGGTKSDTAALSIDLAPTILDMAGIERPDHMDGKSLLPFITVRQMRIGQYCMIIFVTVLQFYPPQKSNSLPTIRRQTT